MHNDIDRLSAISQIDPDELTGNDLETVAGGADTTTIPSGRKTVTGNTGAPIGASSSTPSTSQIGVGGL